jgi:hypothetical protein
MRKQQSNRKFLGFFRLRVRIVRRFGIRNFGRLRIREWREWIRDWFGKLTSLPLFHYRPESCGDADRAERSSGSGHKYR